MRTFAKIPKMIRVIALGAFLFASHFVQAQKFGHVHSVNLLAQLPEIALADSMLVLYQNELMARGDSMVAVFRQQYDLYVKDAQSGTLSKMQAQARESQLQQEQEKIQTFEKEAQMLIMKRRQELYDPVLNKIDEIILQIGQEEGYSMIFDSSQQAMLYLTPTEDISAKILARLNP